MTPVIDVSRDELIARRTEVLRRIELSESEFERVRETRSLSSDEWEAKEELEEISVLLGDEG